MNELRRRYKEVQEATVALYGPLLLRQTRIQHLRAAAAEIANSRALLSIPGLIRDNIQREEYEAVVANCLKGRKMAAAWIAGGDSWGAHSASASFLVQPPSASRKFLGEQVQQEIEEIVAEFRDVLMRQLTGGTAKTEDAVRAMGFLKQLGQVGSREEETPHVVAVAWQAQHLTEAIKEMRIDYAAKVAALKAHATLTQQQQQNKGGYPSLSSSSTGSSAGVAGDRKSLKKTKSGNDLGMMQQLISPFVPEDDALAADFVVHVSWMLEVPSM